MAFRALYCLFVVAVLPNEIRAFTSDVKCPHAGYLLPDAKNLCVYWMCQGQSQPAIKMACPKGTRIAAWWEGGELGPCVIHTSLDRGTSKGCLRCDFHDTKADNGCGQENHSCAEGCKCIDIKDFHTCICPNVDSGRTLDDAMAASDINQSNSNETFCENNPCANGGSCQNQWDDFFCSCPPQWTGKTCETPICDENPCLNGGSCVVDEVGYHCECTECWTGPCCKEAAISCEITAQVEPCSSCYTGPLCSEPVTNLCSCQDNCGAGYKCIDGLNRGDNSSCVRWNPSAGKSFTIMFEENVSENTAGEEPLEIYVSSAFPNNGTRQVAVRSAGLPSDDPCYFEDEVVVEENSVLKYPVERCMMQRGSGAARLAINIAEKTGRLILVYGMNRDVHTADAFLGIPDQYAGTKYQTASYAPSHIGSQFSIVALENDTTVTLTFADRNDIINEQGAAISETLHAFMTYQVQARCPENPRYAFCNKDLSGSVIESNKPIHVFSGNVRSMVNGRSEYSGYSRDHLIEQMIPTNRWGKEFAFMSIPGRAIGDVLNIVALQGETTTVDIYTGYGDEQEVESLSLPRNGRLNAFKEIPSGKGFYISSDKPLSVTLMTKSRDKYIYGNESLHDPSSITIPSTDLFTNYFNIRTPMFTGGYHNNPKPYNTTYAMLVAKKGQEQTILINGNPLKDRDISWMLLPSIDQADEDQLVGVAVSLIHGVTEIKSSEGHKFQCLIYGFDDRESYGFPAGMNLEIKF